MITSCQQVSAGKILMRWNSVPGATQYGVNISSDGTNYQRLGSVNDLGVYVSGLDKQRYWFTVQAYVNSVYQQPSNPVSIYISYAAAHVLAQPTLQMLDYTTQLENITVEEGQRAVFTLMNIEGTQPLSYQWYLDRNNGQGWQPISGATGSTYTIDSAEAYQNGFRYYCKITDANGVTVDTNPAVLTVVPTGTVVLPQTGDDSNPLALLGLVLLSLGGIAVMMRRKKKTTE